MVALTADVKSSGYPEAQDQVPEVTASSCAKPLQTKTLSVRAMATHSSESSPSIGQITSVAVTAQSCLDPC